MDARAQQENTISIDLGHKTIYLYNIEDRENPIELAFQPKYLVWRALVLIICVHFR